VVVENPAPNDCGCTNNSLLIDYAPALYGHVYHFLSCNGSESIVNISSNVAQAGVSLCLPSDASYLVAVYGGTPAINVKFVVRTDLTSTGPPFFTSSQSMLTPYTTESVNCHVCPSGQIYLPYSTEFLPGTATSVDVLDCSGNIFFSRDFNAVYGSYNVAKKLIYQGPGNIYDLTTNCFPQVNAGLPSNFSVRVNGPDSTATINFFVYDWHSSGFYGDYNITVNSIYNGC